MQLHALGINYRHEKDFSIERPNGSGDNLLVVFKSCAEVMTDSAYIRVNPDSAIVYSKDFPQYYRACEKEFINHWIHFDIEENEGFFERIRLPFNTIFNISDISSAENILNQLSLEQISGGANKSECTDLLLRLLMAKLGGEENPAHSSAHFDKLRELRAAIYRNPSAKLSISDYADMVSLSPSYFQSLYKSEFGVTCYEDVITARIDMAKYFLKNTLFTVSAIAELCGYENDVHFIRQFKKRTGMTAGEYRKEKNL